MKDNLKEQLDKEKIFVIQHGALISLITFLIVIVLLATLKIKNISILQLGINYYFQ